MGFLVLPNLRLFQKFHHSGLTDADSNWVDVTNNASGHNNYWFPQSMCIYTDANYASLLFHLMISLMQRPIHPFTHYYKLESSFSWIINFMKL